MTHENTDTDAYERKNFYRRECIEKVAIAANAEQALMLAVEDYVRVLGALDWIDGERRTSAGEVARSVLNWVRAYENNIARDERDEAGG